MTKMYITQAEMQKAMQYWLNNVVLQRECIVKKVTLDRSAVATQNTIDHFEIHYDPALEADDAPPR